MKVHLQVYGRVQGVFFRRSAKVEADKLGLFGWVRNNNDGTVEIQAGGDKENLERFVKWCKKGPPFANVENVEVAWSEDRHEGEGFEIVD